MRDTLARFVARLGGGDGGSDAGTPQCDRLV